MGRRRGSQKGVSASTRHHIWWLKHVEANLSPRNMHDVMVSPFGHLFDIPEEFQFQGQLYVIMSKQLRSSSLERKCLEIEIGNSLVEFGPADFALMSGLRINGSMETPKASEFHNEVFGGRNRLFMEDIKRKFDQESNKDGDSLVSLKLAYLYIVYGVVLMDGRPTTRLNLDFMHLIDNLETFKQFPWGRASYQILVARTHDAKKHINDLESNGKERKCEAQGFLYPLQAWAYEIFPELASYCADRNPEPVLGWARMLHWLPHKRASFDDVYPFFLTGCSYHPVKIQLTEGEEQFLEALGVDASMKVAAPRPIERQPRMKKRCNEAEDTLSPPRSSKRLKGKMDSPHTTGEQLESNPPITKGEGGIAELKDLIEKAYNSVRQDMVAMEGRLVSRMQKLATMVKDLNDQFTSDKKATDVHEESNDSSGTESEDRKDVDCAPVEEDHRASSSDHILIMKDVRPASSDPFQVMNSPDCRTSSLDRVVQLAIEGVPGYFLEPPLLEDGLPLTIYSEYDVNQDNWNEADLKSFSSWKAIALKNKKLCGSRVNLLRVPGDILQWADVDWFSRLCSARGWLENFHIDSLINLVAYNYDHEKSTMQRDWAVLDMKGVNLLLSKDFISHACAPYLNGDIPRLCGIPWERASHLFGVGNVGKDHWVLFKVSFLQQQVIVYDSLSTPSSTICGYFDHLRRNFPRVMRSKQLWGKLATDIPLRDEWEIVICPNTPKQSNGHDCGIMAMKFMECLIRELPLKKIIPSRGAIYRRSYCAQLYAWSQQVSGGTH